MCVGGGGGVGEVCLNVGKGVVSSTAKTKMGFF